MFFSTAGFSFLLLSFLLLFLFLFSHLQAHPKHSLDHTAPVLFFQQAETRRGVNGFLWFFIGMK